MPITIDTHEAALRIGEKYGYEIYDALILAAALDGECETLCSEDLQDGQIIDGRLSVRKSLSVKRCRIQSGYDRLSLIKTSCAYKIHRRKQPVPTGNPIVLKKRKRQARGNEIGWALGLLCSHCWGPDFKCAAQGEAQVERGA
jgi:hypothetical protein